MKKWLQLREEQEAFTLDLHPAINSNKWFLTCSFAYLLKWHDNCMVSIIHSQVSSNVDAAALGGFRFFLCPSFWCPTSGVLSVLNTVASWGRFGQAGCSAINTFLEITTQNYTICYYTRAMKKKRMELLGGRRIFPSSSFPSPPSSISLMKSCL